MLDQECTGRQYVRAIVLVALFVPTAGCAAFPSGQLPVIEEIASPPGPKPSANVSFKFRATEDGIPMWFGLTDLVNQKQERKSFLEALNQTEVFSEVGEDLPNADLDLEVTLHLSVHGNYLLAFICGYSLYTIPAFGTDNYILDANVTINRSGESHQIHVEDFNTLWIHLSMIPLAPFNMLHVRQSEICDSIYKNFVNELSEDGILSAARPSYRSDVESLSQQTGLKQKSVWGNRFDQSDER